LVGRRNAFALGNGRRSTAAGLPLKAVFERIARETGRRPNSIRNYYYAQVAKREGGGARTARFVPFTEQEVVGLMEQVLRDRAQGRSVRSCLTGCRTATTA
jgi:hypothetical protein